MKKQDPLANLRAFKAETGYTHAHAVASGQWHVYSVDKCEVCGCDVQAANSVKINTFSAEDMIAAGFTIAAPPAEGGYSELHECATCDACCYDAAAPERAREAAKARELEQGSVRRSRSS